MSWTRASSPRGWCAAKSALALALAVGPAAAEPVPQSTTGDAAMAETLFEDAKKLMAAGDYATACPKLAESNRLDPGTGTLTALALCHEQLGKTASAWAEFIEVITQAQRAGRVDREKFARQHVAVLEPRLSRLTITVADETAHLKDVVVRRDAVDVGAAAWGVASPVDPGEHVVDAAAPGRKPWSQRVAIAPNGEAKSVAVPALELAPAEDVLPVPEGPPAPPPATTNSKRTVGIVVAASGGAVIAVGSYFGVQALSKSADAKRLCSPSSCTNPSAVQINEDAKTNARVADVLLSVGLVAVGVGAYLFFTSANQRPAPAAGALILSPTVSPAGGGATVEGAF